MTPTDDDYKRAMQLAVAIANEPETFPDVEAIANAIARTLAEQRERDAQILIRYAVNLNGSGKIKPLIEDGRGVLDVVRSSYAHAIRTQEETP